MKPISFLMPKYSLIFPLLFIISCNKKWDPDQQFIEQSEKIRLEHQSYQTQLQQDAIKNLRDFESEILLKVRSGLSIQQFNQLIGYKYSILAQNTTIGKRWERRIYKWDEIIESKWSNHSLEYKECEKNREFFIITTNDVSIIAVEYL
ncbi:MAG: hypothetical protein HOI39_03940 [Flavobacteriales bacterium]|nr:hypothetical protein [Flavobacteriales bacterium]